MTPGIIALDQSVTLFKPEDSLASRYSTDALGCKVMYLIGQLRANNLRLQYDSSSG